MIALFLIKDMKQGFYVILWHFNLIFDVAYHCNDAILEKIVIDVGLGKLIENIEDVRIVILVGK